MTIGQLLKKYKGDEMIYLFVNNHLNGNMYKDKFMKVYKDLMSRKDFEFDISDGLEIYITVKE